MRIEEHIKLILAKYGRVEVRGLGLIRVVARHAKVEEGELMPPGAELEVVRAATANDRLLVDSYVRDRKVSAAEAVVLIGAEARDLDFRELEKDLSFLPANFGLVKVALPKEKPLEVKLWKYAAAAVVAVLVDLAIPVGPAYDNMTEAAIGTDVYGCVKEIVTEQVEEETVDKGRFCVIVASLPSRESAMNYILKKGAGELIDKGGFYRVSERRFEDFDAAQAYIDQNGIHAWVLMD